MLGLAVPIISAIASAFINKGANVLGEAVKAGGQVVLDKIEEKTGVKIESPEDVHKIPSEDLIKFQAEHELDLLNLIVQDANRASEERKAWIQSSDEYVRRTRPWTLRVLVVNSVILAYTLVITHLVLGIVKIRTNSSVDLSEFLHMALYMFISFLSLVGSMLGAYTVKRSQDKATEKGIPTRGFLQQLLPFGGNRS